MKTKTPHALQWLAARPVRATPEHSNRCNHQQANPRPRLHSARLGLLAIVLTVCFGPMIAIEADAGPLRRLAIWHRANVERRIERRHRHDRDPQPFVNPSPTPTPLPPIPPIPLPPPAPAPIISDTNGPLWFVVVVPSLTTQTFEQASIERSIAVRNALATKGNHLLWCDPATAPSQIMAGVTQAKAAGLPRVFCADSTKPAGQRITGMAPLATEQALLEFIKTAQEGK